jgi:hypothetical protein
MAHAAPANGNNGNGTLRSILLFYGGSKDAPKDALSAKDYVIEVEDRKNSYNWDEAVTMGHVVASFRGDAREWFHSALKSALRLPGEYDALKTDWTTIFKPIFCKHYDILGNTHGVEWSKITVQKSGQDPVQFIDKCMASLAKDTDAMVLVEAAFLAVVMPDEDQIVIRALNVAAIPAVPAAGNNPGVVGVPANLIGDRVFRTVQRMLDERQARFQLLVEGNYNKKIIANGLLDKKFRQKALDLSAVPNLRLGDFADQLISYIHRNKEETKKHPNGNGNANGNKKNKKVHAVYEDEDDGDDDSEVAAVTKRQPNKVVCTYCKKPNHKADVCRKKIAAHAAAAHKVHSATAAPAATTSASPVSMQTNDQSGFA